MRVRVVAPVVVASLIVATSAMATPELQLRVTQGAHSATVDAADTGLAAYGPATIGKFLASAVGLGDPVLVQPDGYAIDLLGGVTSDKTGTISIALTESNLVRPPGSLPFHESFGGTLPKGWTITLDAYFDAANAAFGTADRLFSYSFTAPAGQPSSGFSVDANNFGLVGLTPFSITDVVTIKATSLHQAASFDVASTDLPEPASIVLFGVGLLGVGFARRHTKSG